MTEVKRIQEIVEKGLNELDVSGAPIELYDPISYTLKLGGKRMRPVLSLLACEMCGGTSDAALSPALGIEFFHNFTLLHDDIMDEAPLRRGKETVYKKYNANTAILSGDVMMVMAYQLIAKSPKQVLKKVLDRFSATAIEVCEGQQFDLVFENQRNVSIDKYLEMIRLKTAVLLGCSMSIGALIGNGDTRQVKLLNEVGEQTGMAFQMQDDILDTFGDPDKFGKQVGGDIIQNKKTFLVLKALENANKSQRQTLESWLSVDDFDKEEKVAAVSELFRETGAYDDAIQLRDQYFNRAMVELEKADLQKEPKEAFIQLAHQLLNRDK